MAASLAGWLREWIVEPVPFGVKVATTSQTESVEVEHRDLVHLGLACCSDRADGDNPSDAAVLVAVGSAMVADLAERLGSGGDHRFLTTGADWTLRIAIDDAMLTSARRSVAGSQREPSLAPLSQAIAGETARLGCHLGKATLAAGDIAALTVGDVVVLSRAVQATVPLTIEHALPSSGAARIVADDGTFRVTITEPLDLLRKN